ncbi:MAG TPA: TonB-dependent receptor plug domain-containing protein [Candidatus Acidoferrales bacterium]|nr:TonB-dependent receptor plug domain-containing protein [Candidatus Acidoferrales bacterium]
MNIQVTSVSKKAQKVSQVAAAIFVITQEDIRQSGAADIPDLLRMVPGLDVSQINANSWAISARGFNGQFSNKLLVLIDGRAVYTPLLGGVNWDTQDVPLEDIDRIEVIRGPGATIWGANAVNGVINIVTKSAAETKGGLISGGGGTEGQAYGTAQFGGSLRGKTDYRIFTNYLNHNYLPEVDGTPGLDAWHLMHGGFRADTNISTKDSLTVQGDLYAGEEGAGIIHIFSIQPPVIGNLDSLAELSGGDILARWNHSFSSPSDTTFQLYFDNYTRSGPQASETRHTFDFDFNHHFVWGSRQEVIWGAGYRRTWDSTLGTIDDAFTQPDTALDLFSFFVQDTITLNPDRVYLTAGTKLENSYFSGYGLEPTVRLTWTPSNWLTLWSAVSRAERSPARRDTELIAPLSVFPDPAGSSTPVEVILFGNPKFQSEHVLAYEAGFRTQPNGRLSVDVSTFFNRYDHLESLEPGPETLQTTPPPARFVMPILFGNLLYGTTEGGEVSANVKLTDRWTLSPGYAFLEMHLHTKPTSQDTTSVAEYQGSSPQHQAQLRSHVELFHGLSWDASAYFVSALPVQGVASYTRIDTQLRWKLAERAELAVVGQNLLHDHHLESNDQLTLVNPSLIKRSAYARLTWRFW